MLGENLGPQKAFPHLLILVLLGNNLVLAAGSYAGRAHACSCAGTGSTEEALQRATAVFSGEVKGIGGLPQEGEGMVPPWPPSPST